MRSINQLKNGKIFYEENKRVLKRIKAFKEK